MAKAARAVETKRQTFRCAIYTRKSSEDGLEQDFNSLDAQREACEAYILSQRHEGWVALPQMYDDGGISGGTMERPSLKRLLADIGAGKIDIVVVYKVDRLTRSLADFAKIVEIFDGQSTSFVSVTQAFNTTSSMGRLTLNVLLSFAQFEREVTGERIRDKIAASKKKGMWMGGLPPLGYDVQDRKLILNEAEAETVRLIFQRYATLKSVRRLQAELDRLRIVSKSRLRANGTAYGGQPIGRGALYAMLSNRIYRGEIVHKESAHPGLHDALVDEALWTAVQQTLVENRIQREHGSNADEPSLLAGLLFDAEGQRLTPTHTNKKGTRYRYYVSQALITPRDALKSSIEGPRQRDGQRLPAANLERLIKDRLQQFLADPAEITAKLAKAGQTAIDQSQLIDRAARRGSLLAEAGDEPWRVSLLAIVQRIAIQEDRIEIGIDTSAMTNWLSSPIGAASMSDDAAGGTDGIVPSFSLTIPVRLQRRGNEMRLVVPGVVSRKEPDAGLVRILVRAHKIRDQLFGNLDLSVQEIAVEEDVTPSYVTRILRLTFLAPDILASILSGQQPVSLTAAKLMKDTRLPMDWAEQRAMLGFV